MRSFVLNAISGKRTDQWRHRASPIGLAVFVFGLSALLSGCKPEEAPVSAVVTTVSVEAVKAAPDVLVVSGTGEIKARIQSDLSFKINGRLVSRTVDIGDRVTAGQILATLDPTEQKADIASATAGVAAQEAQVRKAESALQRQRALTDKGISTQQEFDKAQQDFQSAQSSLDAARSQLSSAQEALSQTSLYADASGIITARSAEVGQVVQPSTTIFSLAHDGERDAVFNVQEAVLNTKTAPPEIEVVLLSRPEVRAKAVLREVSPAIDRKSGTVRIKLGIVDIPSEMTLGAAVIATAKTPGEPRISLPWQAVTATDGKPSVWVVNPDTKTVSSRAVVVERYDTGKTILSGGIRAGELVVTEGGQYLRPNQTVRYSEGSLQ